MSFQDSIKQAKPQYIPPPSKEEVFAKEIKKIADLIRKEILDRAKHWNSPEPFSINLFFSGDFKFETRKVIKQKKSLFGNDILKEVCEYVVNEKGIAFRNALVSELKPDGIVVGPYTHRRIIDSVEYPEERVRVFPGIGTLYSTIGLAARPSWLDPTLPYQIRSRYINPHATFCILSQNGRCSEEYRSRYDLGELGFVVSFKEEA